MHCSLSAFKSCMAEVIEVCRDKMAVDRGDESTCISAKFSAVNETLD